MICTLCRGSQWLITFVKGSPEWWACPKCGASGVSVQHGPALIGPGTRKACIALAALTLLSATQAQADDLRIPAGTILCPTMAGPTSETHAGCWRAIGGQRVEVIAALSAVSQLRVWSTNGAESLVAWTTRTDADAMQRKAGR